MRYYASSLRYARNVLNAGQNRVISDSLAAGYERKADGVSVSGRGFELSACTADPSVERSDPSVPAPEPSLLAFELSVFAFEPEITAFEVCAVPS
jgi:hypothetical protein